MVFQSYCNRVEKKQHQQRKQEICLPPKLITFSACPPLSNKFMKCKQKKKIFYPLTKNV